MSGGWAVWSALAVLDGLIEQGLRYLVVCPGSRSAPLVYAAQARQRDLDLWVRLDERSAGFSALGLALADRTGLAGVVTTSGTAAANLHPAMVEASHAGVRLIALTADRPAELQGVGANQTIDQRDLFAAAPRLSQTLQAADAAPDLAVWRAAGTRAGHAAHGRWSARPGPVHLNLRFRDPLTPPSPGEEGADAALCGEGVGAVTPSLPPLHLGHRPQRAGVGEGTPGGGGGFGAPPEHAREGRGEVEVSGAAPGWGGVSGRPSGDAVLCGGGGGVDAPGGVGEGTSGGVVLGRGVRTVVVAGDGAGPEARVLAEQAGWPLLAEPSSGAWAGHAVVPSPEVAAAGPLGDAVQRVVMFGRPTLWRALNRLVTRQDIELVVINPAGAPWPDLGGHADLVATSASAEPGPADDAAWLAEWRRGGDAAWRRAWGGGELLTGPVVAGMVASSCADRGMALVAAASGAVRDLGCGPPPGELRVFASRGAAGIDGTISTAAGVARALGEPVRVLVGDLAFLHDAGGLLR
ncbi:MAG: hypothetical protein LBH48_07595, partial [Bifidobacteriaceae bacterium]|nr:hypothetical protein [Bifidobacteriaceae bacterium]